MNKCQDFASLMYYSILSKGCSKQDILATLIADVNQKETVSLIQVK